MIYQNPKLLYALFAIAIPILIHLFNFRKHKTVYFSSIRFLKEIKEETQKKSELRNILILISRVLAITFLILAFAKPYIPAKNKHKNNTIVLYIDNSQSMDIDFGDGNLLNSAKEKAIQIIKSYTPENNFYLITNDFLSKHISSYTNKTLRTEIEKIKSSSQQRNMTDIISRANNIQSDNSHLYFISDFQEETLSIQNLKNYNTRNRISLIPIKNKNISNISLDSLFISDPIFTSENEVELKVIIKNTSKEDIKEEMLFLYLDNKQKSQQYISLLAGETKEVVFNFLITNNPSISGEIRTHDSPITFDNSLFFTLNKSDKINVSIINTNNKSTAFQALFGRDTSLFNYTSLELANINHNNLLKEDLIILNEVLELSTGLLNTLLSFTNNGGTLLITPPLDLIKFNTYNTLLRSIGLNTIKRKKEDTVKINHFSTKHPVYKNVFTDRLEKINYPYSNQAYYLGKEKIRTQIIGLANQQDFLSAYKSGKGTIYQFTSPLHISYNNFTKHALFVPTLINIASSSSLINTNYYIIGNDKEIKTTINNISNDIIHIKGDNIDIIPTIHQRNGEQLLNYHNQITKNGIYSIISNNKTLDKVAFNYNTSESIISSMNTDELKEFISKNNIKNIKIISTNNTQLNKIITEQENGKEYWKIAILLSLLFFAFEILLIKLIKI